MGKRINSLNSEYCIHFFSKDVSEATSVEKKNQFLASMLVQNPWRQRLYRYLIGIYVGHFVKFLLMA